jgi:diaminohydroxyphosphoribosylaminopyrimidine deaminase/5-amino-6-(5-phosphoribosylamino)uracil reductase
MAASRADERFMRRALELARRGAGRVEPNPCVGAVVVRSGRIVGEGAHLRFGGPHAEVWAVGRAGRRARGATLYTTLEPCSRWGKTPPCTDLVIGAGIRRVVYAARDRHQRGAAALRRAGLAVDGGLLAAEARALNAPFFKQVERGLPYVAAKWAMSLDGRLAAAGGDSRWISSAESRRRTRAERARFQAILVGAGTVRRDDPRLLGVRAAVLGGRIPRRARIVRAGTIVFATRPARLGPATVLRRRRWTVTAALRELARRGVQSLLIEGGRTVLEQAFAEGVVDEVLAVIAPRVIGGARRVSRAVPIREPRVTLVGPDVWVRGRP